MNTVTIVPIMWLHRSLLETTEVTTQREKKLGNLNKEKKEVLKKKEVYYGAK